MDMTFEATAMVAEASVITAVVKAVMAAVTKVTALFERVASFACLSRGGTSLSAVSPDYNVIGGTA